MLERWRGSGPESFPFPEKLSFVFVHRSNSLSALIDALTALLTEPGRPLLERPQIMIQSVGMERYLSRELALRLGVVVGFDFPFPRAFFEKVADEVLGEVPEGASFAREALAFHVFRELGQSEHPEVRGYLESDHASSARLELAVELARLFDQYSVYRPKMLADWERGPSDDFQAEIWGRLGRELGRHDPGARLEALYAASDDDLRSVLPKRLYVFGGAGLPPLFLRVLGRFARVIDVHVFSFTVCQEYFVDAHSADLAPSEVGEGWNPLLVSLGRVGGDFQYYLEQFDYQELTQRFLPEGGDSLLSCLKQDILWGRRRSPSECLPRSTRLDGSISIVSCHSAQREVEVLRETLLDLFEKDRTLRAEDVVVMAPDIGEYAPLIRAVFGGALDATPLIPFRIADQAESSSNPVIASLSRALGLFSRRFKASEVLSVLQMDPVLAAYGMTAQDLERITEWLEGSGTRWGLDDGHLSALGFDEPLFTTWQRGLSRLVLGFAMEDQDQAYGELVPYDDVALGDAALLDRLCEFLGTLSKASRVLTRPCTVEEFSDAVKELTRGLFLEQDGEAQARIFRVLTELSARAARARVTEQISPLALGRVLAAELDSVRQGTDFLAGGVTFCELLPLRTIPFRVACVLGLSEGEFPRSDKESSLDRLAMRRLRGDRLLRTDDRYLFLELIASVQERLILSYVGRSVQDNSRRPPSVIVSELVHVLDAMLEGPSEPFEAFVREHPLQPFSPRYFEGKEAHLVSRSREDFEGALVCARGRGPGELGSEPLLPRSVAPVSTIQIRELESFLKNPSRFFLRGIGVVIDDEIRTLSDREPVALSALDKYLLGEKVLDGLTGERPFDLRLAELRGHFPGGAFGQALGVEIEEECRAIFREIRELTGGAEGRSVDVRIELLDATLEGTVPLVFPNVHVRSSYGQAQAGRLLSTWIRHLCLNASGSSLTSAFVGRNKGLAEIHEFAPLEPAEAHAHLSSLVALYVRARQEPLRFDTAAALAVADKARRPKTPSDPVQRRSALVQAARSALKPSFGRKADQKVDASLGLLYGEDDPLALSVGDPGGEEPRFLELAEVVFGPLLTARQIRSGEEEPS